MTTFTAIPGNIPRTADPAVIAAYAASLIGRRAYLSFGSRVPMTAQPPAVIAEARYDPLWQTFAVTTEAGAYQTGPNVYVEDRPAWPWPADQEQPWAHKAPSIEY